MPQAKKAKSFSAKTRDPKKPSTYGLGKKPFRGRTPKNVFHFVEFGACDAHGLIKMAYSHPNKFFIAVDPLYKKVKIKTNPVPKSPRTMESFLKEMKRRGVTARKLMLRMPSREDMLERRLKIDELFKKAPEVLMPNGKIYITSEFPEVIDLAEYLAKENGFSVRPRKKLVYAKTDIESQVIKQGRDVYMFEATYKLKSAFPGKGKKAKAKRHNWTRE